MNPNLRSRLAVAFLLAPLSALGAASIDEIVVTADFRERSVAEVPFSVSVMDADFIKAAAVQHFEELINVVPNMNWSGDGNRARYFQIRGVGELEQYQGAPNPSIGFVIDDIDFSGLGTIATVFDMQSIEVLRGSQGSRYGANALGGLIYMRSAAPTAERGGRVQVTVGSDDAISVGAAFGGALNEAGTASFRTSIQQYVSNGFRENTFLNRDDTNARDELAFRTRLQFQIGDTVDANVALLYSNIDNGYDAFALDNSYRTLSDKPGKDAQESMGASLRLEWSEFGAGSLTSITSVAHSDVDFSYDADWGNDDSWGAVTYDYISENDRERRTLGQEFRYVTERWLFGLYALNLEDSLATLNQGEYYDPFYDFADSLNYPFDSSYESNSVAVFSQFNKQLGTLTSLSAGLRIERRTTDYSDSESLLFSPSETVWGGEIGISHAFSDTQSSFVTVSRAYKAGGFNLGIVPEERRFFGDEALWTVEFGLRSLFLDGRLAVKTSIFQNWRVDQQVRTSFQLDAGDPTSFGFATLNVDEARTSGLETELTWSANDDWQVYANLGLLDGTFKKVPPDLGLDGLRGRAQAHAPRYTLSAGIVYRDENGTFARLDATAKDEFYFDVSHEQKSRSYALLNARVGYEGESWLVSLWVRNLFDKDYAVRGFYFGNEPPDFPNTLYTRFGDPRQVGVTVEKTF